MNYDGNTEIMSKHTFMITNKIWVLLCFQSFPLHKTLFLTKVIFFQGYPTMFQFSRTFQGHDAFSWTFQGLIANHANGNCKLRTEFASPMAKSTSPRLSDRAFFALCAPWYHNVWLAIRNSELLCRGFNNI